MAYDTSDPSYGGGDSGGSQITDADLEALFGGNDTGSGNTGSSGSGSGSNFLSTLADLAKTGTTAYQSVSQANNPLKTNAAARAAATPTNWKKYLPWIAGAVVLLIALGLIFRRK